MLFLPFFNSIFNLWLRDGSSQWDFEQAEDVFSWLDRDYLIKCFSLLALVQIHCISIGKVATCQFLFLAPRFTLPQTTLALFHRLGKFWSICFCCGKKLFILLFVGKHLKEIEGLNDKRVCIQSGAVLKDCVEERPICWGGSLLKAVGALAGECHRAGLHVGFRFRHFWRSQKIQEDFFYPKYNAGGMNISFVVAFGNIFQ